VYSINSKQIASINRSNIYDLLCRIQSALRCSIYYGIQLFEFCYKYAKIKGLNIRLTQVTNISQIYFQCIKIQILLFFCSKQLTLREKLRKNMHINRAHDRRMLVINFPTFYSHKTLHILIARARSDLQRVAYVAFRCFSRSSFACSDAHLLMHESRESFFRL